MKGIVPDITHDLSDRCRELEEKLEKADELYMDLLKRSNAKIKEFQVTVAELNERWQIRNNEACKLEEENLDLGKEVDEHIVALDLAKMNLKQSQQTCEELEESL